ncbi:MAG: type I DNA topoisomerase [Chloroflexi bacterium]|nr:type I DNA topoisomerase [Chloroflexota bacterium]
MTSDAATNKRTGLRLVIVESPAKARTIARFLGPEYVVESSIGHIRDLPSSAAEIPAAQKKEKWARLGVDVDHDFEPLYIVPASKREQVKKLRALAKDASELFLATDEDREGEAIAWHLREVLKPKVPVRRMVFHEITKSAIEEALASPREIDDSLVSAQEARRILDRLYGYEVSPVLWKKVAPRLSAGRVQSAAIRLIVGREHARMRFHSAAYWDVEAQVRPEEGSADAPDAPNAPNAPIGTALVELGGRRLASGRDFDAETGLLVENEQVVRLDEATARSAAAAVASATFEVSEVVERPYTQRPPAPFITSTLQQEAGRKLRFTAQRTMRGAQELYENGYITYMRTDSTNLSGEALNAARRQIGDLYGAAYLPDSPRTYRTTSKGAQEAHEAIRPAGEIFRLPDSLRGELNSDAMRLYELIWMRTVASQMRDATGLRTNVRLQAPAGEHGTATFAVSGNVITFPGFLRAYVEGSDDPDAELEDQERVLPPLREGQRLQGVGAEARGHETQSPARYTEASLVHELEERGIGRPSTYASIIQTVQDRGYVWKKASALVPTFTAFAVVNLLEQHFADLVDLDFTARMETDLDAVAAGEIAAVPWLHQFYFGDPDSTVEGVASAGLKDRIGSGWEAIDARGISSIPLGQDAAGRQIAARVGRYGPYVQADDEAVRATLPEDLPPDELTLERALELLEQAALGDTEIATDPASGRPIYVKTGRFGPYVQIGEDDEDDGKPKRSSLWPNMTMESLTAEQALELLTYPRTLGTHPESGEPITVQDGPNGPYVRTGAETRSLHDHAHMSSIDLDEALALLKEPKRRGRAAAAALATLGAHPDSAAPIEVRSGRFGPYVSDGVVHASIPKGRDPENVTLDDALELIAAREERLRAEGKDPRAPKAKGRKAPAKARAKARPRTPRKRSA